MSAANTDRADWIDGPPADHRSCGAFVSFSDPDGDTWLLQELTHRLPGRIDATTTSFSSSADPSGAMRRAEAAHGEHEKRIGHAHADWSTWYAAFMVAEQTEKKLPQ